MTSHARKLRTTAADFTKLNMAEFGRGRYQQPRRLKIKEALDNCHGHKRNAERLAKRMVKHQVIFAQAVVK